MDVSVKLEVGCMYIFCDSNTFEHILNNLITNEKFNIDVMSGSVYRIESRDYKDLYFLLKNMEEDYKLYITLGV